MKNFILNSSIIFLTLLGCTIQDPPAGDPAPATLVAPINNETCLDGISLNDTQSDVSFQWLAAENAISYEVVVTNLLTQSSQTFLSPENETTIALNKAEPFAWIVRSIGAENTSPAESEQWRFYLAGDATINYAPFPADLIRPTSGATITPNSNNAIVLNWTAVDVDNDLAHFEVYLDQVDATTLYTTLDSQVENNSLEVNVENNATYFWKVISIDANGNKSSSTVLAFRTN